jgi:serine/threonine-protein kinase
MPSRSICPSEIRWRAFLDGSISAPIAAILEKHLNGCPACQEALERLTAGTEPWLNTARQSTNGEMADGALKQVMEQLEAEGEPVETVSVGPGLDFLAPGVPGSGYMGRLGTYDVVTVIGRGGMSVVLKAFDAALNRFVAIKVLASSWASNGASRARFAREARATAAVRHDNVVAIHGVEEVEGLPYLVMEYVHGTSLQERLDRRGPLEVREILRIGIQIAAGLAAAHAQGLVHRDVKPSNILLENGVDRVKVADFGLARAADDASLTQSGVIAGTPQYMAPEQARGEPIDHRADLFSLGSVLYAMCTGRPPFRAANTVAVLKRVCEDEPRPIGEVNSDIPEWLRAVIARLHAKRPEDRFQSAAEVSRLLSQYLAHLQHPARVPLPASPPSKPTEPTLAARPVRTALWVALAVLGLILLLPILGMSLMRWASDESPPPRPGPVLHGPLPDVQPRMGPRVGPRVFLGNGKLERPADRMLRFSVDYEVQPGAADPIMHYVWVVRCGERTLYERKIRARELGKEGTLHAERPAPRLGLDQPVEMYVESERLIPGRLGLHRERISNVVTVAP